MQIDHIVSSRWLWLMTLIGFSGCGGQQGESIAPPRPVTFMTLTESNPSRLTRLTGSVDSWKKEMLAFRVDGRVDRVVEPGIEIEGRIIDETGDVLQTGTELARLSSARYILLRDEAAARFDSSKAQATQAKVELERLIPERIKAATADLDQKKSEYDRELGLLEKNVTSRGRFELAESEFKQAQAVLARAEAEQATKTAEVAALDAQAKEAEQVLLQANKDLADCVLYSPFAGQISKVHAIAGSFLNEAMPVVTVQMMDPVKVEIAVSEDTDRRIRYNDKLNIYLPDSDEPVSGLVYIKDTVADAATRTFSVTILVRNRRIEIGVPEDLQDKNVARTTDLYGFEARNADGKPPYFIEQSAIHKDTDGKTFVWKVEGIKVADLGSDFDPVFNVKKVYVELGERRLPILQVYQGIEVSDLGDLVPEQDLVVGPLSAEVMDGDQVILSRQEWLLRPGQLVRVELKGQKTEAGFYVPRPAILRNDGKNYIFVAQNSDGGGEVAKRIEVETYELIGDYRRIAPVEPGAVNAGSKLILDGAHYLRDGDSVNAFEEIEVSL